MTDLSKPFDAVVIGAGVAGIYQIKKLKDLGMRAILLESNPNVGGTWYNNRYPGARFDSESYTYGYAFSKEVLNEWSWKELFSAQPDNLEYFNFVTDKFNLRPFMHFNAKVESMRWQDHNDMWELQVPSLGSLQSKFVITAVGGLSVPATPSFPGAETFKGKAFHSFDWPHEPLNLEGKKVGVVGTGATGIQIIAEIADKVQNLTVFQRRPNWSKPLKNQKLDAEHMQAIRDRYDEIFENCAASYGGFEHKPNKLGYHNLSATQRKEVWDTLYEKGGFAFQLSNFPETFFDNQANKELSDYVADRIRQRVHNPEIAEKLIPKDHGFGMQRLPLETNYFEAYNRDNVALVDVSQTPIIELDSAGIQTSEQHFELDIIVYATGFDAITGALDAIDIVGKNNIQLKENWADNPSTYLGIMSHGFPNLLMLAGPQSVSGSTNYPRAIEAAVNWVSELMHHLKANDIQAIEPEVEAEKDWNHEVKTAQDMVPVGRSKSWFTGYNSNIKDREQGNIRYHAYWGGAPRYQEFLSKESSLGYPNFNQRK